MIDLRHAEEIERAAVVGSRIRFAGTFWFMPALTKWSAMPAGAAGSAEAASVSSGTRLSARRDRPPAVSGESSSGSANGRFSVGGRISVSNGICQRAAGHGLDGQDVVLGDELAASGGLVLSSVTKASKPADLPITAPVSMRMMPACVTTKPRCLRCQGQRVNAAQSRFSASASSQKSNQTAS